MANLVDTSVNGDLRVIGTMFGTQAGNYATCATAAGTAAKAVTISGFTLTTGIHVYVKFTVTNTAAVASLTLNVSGTGAKAMKYRGGNLPAVGTLSASRVYEFIYDGTNWELVGDLDTNTQTVTGVKGNAESSYRTGQVNLTAANIGASASDHTHGNIGNGGTLTDTAAAAAGNDYVVIRDADNNKVQTSTIKGTDVADAVSKKHSHSTLTLSTTAQAYDGTHTLALPSSDPYTSARTPTSHTHGNIANGGTLTDTAAAAAGNDYVVIRDADNNKVQTSTIKGTDVADAVSKKHSHSTLTLSTTAQAYDGSHTLALPSTDPYTSARTPTSHTHGNITNGGALQTNDITIASGDKLVVTDSSDSSKVARASISFDGSTTTQALTKAGTWATFNNYSHPAGNAPSKTGVPTGDATPGFGGTFKVNQITTDSTSHVSAVTERTITIPNSTATTSAAGLMSAADKTKLDRKDWILVAGGGSTEKDYRMCDIGDIELTQSWVGFLFKFEYAALNNSSQVNNSESGTFEVRIQKIGTDEPVLRVVISENPDVKVAKRTPVIKAYKKYADGKYSVILVATIGGNTYDGLSIRRVFAGTQSSSNKDSLVKLYSGTEYSAVSGYSLADNVVYKRSFVYYNGSAIGTNAIPVYINEYGKPVECTTYAGGTAVTLNNSSKAGSTASFYAPTAGGTANYVLIGNGTTSAPTWAEKAPKASVADYVNLLHTNEVNFKNVPTSGNKERVWFNYRNGDTDAGDANNLITQYYFGNRNLSTGGVTLIADNFSGNASTATTSTNSNNTKVTTANTTKTYLAGANATGYTSGAQTSLLTDTGIYATTTAGELNATQFKVNEHCTMKYNSTKSSLDFTFS